MPCSYGPATVMRTSSTPASTAASVPASMAVSRTATSCPLSDGGSGTRSDRQAGAWAEPPPLTATAVTLTGLLPAHDLDPQSVRGLAALDIPTQ